MRDTGRVAGAGLLLGAGAALIVIVLGAQPAVRGWYGLHPDAPSSASTAHIFATNLQLCAGALFGAVNLRVWPRARWILDPLLGGLLALNTLLVGAALGAYGTPLLRLVAAHGALELLAIGVAGSAYLQAHRATALTVITVAWCAAATTALLILAAVLEAHGA